MHYFIGFFLLTSGITCLVFAIKLILHDKTEFKQLHYMSHNLNDAHSDFRMSVDTRTGEVEIEKVLARRLIK